jgi:hypothetical protein
MKFTVHHSALIYLFYEVAGFLVLHMRFNLGWSNKEYIFVTIY